MVNKTLLLTRTLEDSNRIKQDFIKLGYDVVISPVLNIKHHQINIDYGEIDGLIITSTNALHVLNKSFNIPIFCVGQYCANQCYQLGYTNISYELTAQKLFDLITLTLPTEVKLLFLSGKNVSYPIGKKLEKSGYKCNRIICYEALAAKIINQTAQKLLENDAVDVIPFYSRRSFEIFIKLLHKIKVKSLNAKIILISKNCIRAKEYQIFGKVCIAKAPEHKQILAIIKEA